MVVVKDGSKAGRLARQLTTYLAVIRVRPFEIRRTASHVVCTVPTSVSNRIQTRLLPDSVYLMDSTYLGKRYRREPCWANLVVKKLLIW